MSGTRKLEHVQLSVENLPEAVEFYKEVMGLVEFTNKDETVYLSCGLDDGYDLAITEGRTGIDHFAIRVPDNDLEKYRDFFSTSETKTEQVQLPGEKEGIEFDLPSGIRMQMVTTPSEGFLRSVKADPNRRDAAPIDLDHVNLLTTDVEKDVTFLQETLGFNISEVSLTETGVWRQAFTRFGDYHHDVAFSASANFEESLHHVAWTMSSCDHMKSFHDVLAQSDIRLEVGLSRHFVGNNLFSYIWEPGGNRFEFCSEMATLADDISPTFHDSDVNTFSAWGGIEPPASFGDGS